MCTYLYVLTCFASILIISSHLKLFRSTQPTQVCLMLIYTIRRILIRVVMVVAHFLEKIPPVYNSLVD